MRTGSLAYGPAFRLGERIISFRSFVRRHRLRSGGRRRGRTVHFVNRFMDCGLRVAGGGCTATAFASNSSLLAVVNAQPLALLRQYLHSQGSAAMRKPESYYRPKRDDFAAGMTIAFAIFAALVRGAQQWMLIVRGVRRLDPARG